MKGDNRYKFSRKIFKEASSRCICLLLKSLPSFDEAFVSEDEYYRRSLLNRKDIVAPSKTKPPPPGVFLHNRGSDLSPPQGRWDIYPGAFVPVPRPSGDAISQLWIGRHRGFQPLGY